MSQENVEIVRQLIALGEQIFVSGLPPPHTDLVSPDAEIDLSRRVFNPATYHGIAGWAKLNEEIREVWEEWRVTPERYVDVGDRVVVIGSARGRGRGSGVEVEVRYGEIWTLRDGRVTRLEAGLDPEAALKAVGLEE